MMESYMVVTLDKKRTFFNETNTCVGTTFEKAKSFAEKTKGELFTETTKPYRFVKNGKTCKGSERWLSLTNMGHNID